MSDLLSQSARLVVLVPFVASLLGLAVARRRFASAVIASTGGVVTLLAATYVLYGVHNGPFTPEVSTIGALPLGSLQMPLHLLLDDLSAIVVFAVAIVGLAIQLFTKWYLHDDDRYGVFTATVSLFLAGMLLVVLSGDLVLTLVGWEVMGWCSYLLIGHNSRKDSASRAAIKAFLVTRTADLAFVIGLIILAAGARTTSIPDLMATWSGTPGAALTAAFLCLLSGIAGKSAQFPFHDWLPDAMEGPTPASALIHAATMVAAGTFVLARLFPIFVLSDPARLVLAVITAVTMIGAAILAFGQSDLKRLLAYSTISQIAIMLSALAIAPVTTGSGPAVLYLLSHAMFKALLFLAIGWLSVLVAGTSAVKMSGGVRHHPALKVPLAIGFLALAGVPPLVGFVAKEFVLGAAHDNASESGSAAGWIVMVAVGMSVVLTAAYCTRAWLVLTHLSAEEEVTHEAAIKSADEVEDVSLLKMFTEPAAGSEITPESAPASGSTVVDVHAEPEHGHADIHRSARLSVGLLAFLSVVGGLIIFTPLVQVEPHITWWLAISSLVLILATGFTVQRMALSQGSGDAAERLGADRMVLFDKGFGTDGVYVAVASRVVQLARVVVLADREVIDAYVRGTVVATRWIGIASERTHTRKPSSYLVWVLIGLLAVGATGVTLW
jgi:NADH:ubiquinone oxidoreductase subunit 5 (chain L)/Multisubunit Na+/H+ antiporter, MnhA subunit